MWKNHLFSPFLSVKVYFYERFENNSGTYEKRKKGNTHKKGRLPAKFSAGSLPS